MPIAREPGTTGSNEMTEWSSDLTREPRWLFAGRFQAHSFQRIPWIVNMCGGIGDAM